MPSFANSAALRGDWLSSVLFDVVVEKSDQFSRICWLEDSVQNDGEFNRAARRVWYLTNEMITS